MKRDAIPSQADFPVQQRDAQFVPASFDEKARTVDVVWTTGAKVRRYDWWNDEVYEEELVVSREAINMARFEAGTVQVLDGHRTYGGVSAILGVADRGWVENGQGLAKLRLSGRDEVAGIVSDIQAGIIRSISFGYSVQRYEITRAKDRTDGGKLPLYRAVEWTPQEISFVTVPADADAHVRSQQRSQGDKSPCEFIRAAAHPKGARSMDDENAGGANPATPAATTQPPAVDVQAERSAAADEARTAERTRIAEITALCTKLRMPEKAEQFVKAGATVEQARAAVLEEIAARDVAAGGHRNVSVETVSDETATRMQGLEEAIAHRVNPAVKLGDNGRQYRGMSLLEMGREHLERSGVSTRGLSKLELATRMLSFRSGGMMTTSDFANLFANVAGKRLRQAYDENNASFRAWARRAPNLPDFKPISVVQLGAAPDLLQVNEHGEFKYGSMTDGAVTYQALTYGRMVSLSRQALVNDDLRSFDRLVSAFGSSAARLENRLVYAILTANANMPDGVAMFHATHGNLGTGAPSALQLSALTAARTAMRLQKGLQSEELNITPQHLIVPAALEQTAYQLTSANYVPATQANVSEFRAGGKTAVTPVVEALLDANSATAWYLAADNGAVDTVEYAYVDGSEGPVIESEVGFEVDGITYKCREDFAAKAIDHRGLYKANGA